MENCIHRQSKNSAAKKALMDQRLKYNLSSPCLHTYHFIACSFIFHSHVCPYELFLIHF